MIKLGRGRGYDKILKGSSQTRILSVSLIGPRYMLLNRESCLLTLSSKP